MAANNDTVLDFPNDDDAYQDWIERHPDGYVINILRGYGPNGARLHRARCWAINRRRGKWIGQYVKVCSTDLAGLDHWAVETVSTPIARCGHCHPAGPRPRPR